MTHFLEAPVHTRLFTDATSGGHVVFLFWLPLHLGFTLVQSTLLEPVELSRMGERSRLGRGQQVNKHTWS